MLFQVDHSLLQQVREKIVQQQIYWLLGGAGSGKSTIAQQLVNQYELTLYDMDTHIYGSYHERFTDARHPVNKAWANAENGIAWLLNMDWDEFSSFHKAALPEYLDLFSVDLAETTPEKGLLVDGGLWHPALLTQVLPPARVVCLATDQTSADIWEGSPERRA